HAGVRQARTRAAGGDRRAAADRCRAEGPRDGPARLSRRPRGRGRPPLLARGRRRGRVVALARGRVRRPPEDRLLNRLEIRLVIALAVIVATWVIAKLIDRYISRRTLDPATATRYRVLRRSIFGAIVFIGFLSAML